MAGLSGRELLEVDAIVDDLVGGWSMDRSAVKRELLNISEKISVPAGLLRADDVLEDLIGVDYFVGDAVMEIERRLQLLGAVNFNRLTIRKVIFVLVQIG